MSFEPKIEKGVPIPGYNLNNHNAKGYSKVLRKLEPGDCVWLPTNLKAIANSCSRIFGRGQFTSRSENDGIRVWRKPLRSAMLSVVARTHAIRTPEDMQDDQKFDKKQARR